MQTSVEILLSCFLCVVCFRRKPDHAQPWKTSHSLTHNQDTFTDFLVPTGSISLNDRRTNCRKTSSNTIVLSTLFFLSFFPSFLKRTLLQPNLTSKSNILHFKKLLTPITDFLYISRLFKGLPLCTVNAQVMWYNFFFLELGGGRMGGEGEGEEGARKPLTRSKYTEIPLVRLFVS